MIRLDIALPAGLAQLVAAKVAEGAYVDEADVIRDALRDLQTQGPASANSVGFDLSDAIPAMMMELADLTREDLKSMSVLATAHRVAMSRMCELLGKIAKDIAANAGKTDNTEPLDLSNGLGSERMYHHVGIPTLDAEDPGAVRMVTTDLWPGEITTVDQLGATIDAIADALSSNGSSHEMGMIKLQSAIAARDQAIQLVANMFRAVKDSSRGIIHNIG